MDKIKYVLYARTSTTTQDFGLQSQLSRMKDYLNQNEEDDYEIIAEFQEQCSGKDMLKQEKLMEAIRLCQKERAILGVWNIDRLTRDSIMSSFITQIYDIIFVCLNEELHDKVLYSCALNQQRNPYEICASLETTKALMGVALNDDYWKRKDEILSFLNLKKIFKSYSLGDE